MHADQDAYLVIETAAAEIRMSRSTFYRRIKEGRVPILKVGGQPRVRRGDLSRLLLADKLRRGVTPVDLDDLLIAAHEAAQQ